MANLSFGKEPVTAWTPCIPIVVTQSTTIISPRPQTGYNRGLTCIIFSYMSTHTFCFVFRLGLNWILLGSSYESEGFEGINKIADGYNPTTWMLEVSMDAQELILGVNLVELYQNSYLNRWVQVQFCLTLWFENIVALLTIVGRLKWVGILTLMLDFISFYWTQSLSHECRVN